MVFLAMDETPLVLIAAAALMQTQTASAKGLLEVTLGMQHCASACKLGR